MAINLSRSFARPCDILCDLTIDDVAISQAIVSRGNQFLILEFYSQRPTLKFNGEGYTVTALAVKSPSYHTIEDIRADAELVAFAINPAGNIVCMSILLRTNTASSPAKTFLNGFVPYIVKNQSITVNLGDTWSLTQIIPSDPSYYAYKGGVPWGQGNVQWIVFRSMGNIDPTDYAILVKNTSNVPTEIISRGDTQVFFNDTAHIAGVPDGKAYMRCKRVKKKGESEASRVTPVAGLSDSAAKGEAKATKQPDYSGFGGTLNWMYFSIVAYLTKNGAGSVVGAVIYAFALIVGVYSAYSLSQSDKGLSLARSAQNMANRIVGMGTKASNALLSVPRQV